MGNLDNNTTELEDILQTINNLPDASSTPSEAVLYIEQTLTEKQKAQARANIGVEDVKDAYAYAQEGGYAGTKAAFAEKLAQENPVVTQNLGDDEKAVMSQAAVTSALENFITLPYGASKEWLDTHGDTSQLYQIDGYVWGYVESNGWTKSSKHFLVVSSESEMTNEGGTEYLLRNGNSGTVYSYTEESGEAGIPVYSSLPTSANNGDIVAVGGRKYKATVKTTEVKNYTNLADPTSADWKPNYRLSSSGLSAENGSLTTNIINMAQNDVIRIKGLNISNKNLTMWQTSGQKWVYSKYTDYVNNGTFQLISGDTEYVEIKLKSAYYNQIRFSGIPNSGNVNDVDDIIITINQPITSEVTTTVDWVDIGEYIPYVEAGWYATIETFAVIDSLSATANNNDVAVYSADGYSYTYFNGASWMQTSKYDKPILSIDGEFSNTSTNAIQNKVVKKAFDDMGAIVGNHTNDIAEINLKLEDISTDGNSVPEFWKEAVDGLADRMKEIQANASKVFQFVWFSDMHGVNNFSNANYQQPTAGTSCTRNIGRVAQYVAEKYDIPFVALSGDVMSQTSHTLVSTVYEEYENIREVLSPIDRDKFLCVKGNHDGAWGAEVNGVSYLKNIGNKENYNTLYRRQAGDRNRVFGGNGTYFYVDSPQKVRFIMLNCHTDGDGSIDENGYPVYNAMKSSVYGTEQLKWLAEVALDVPEGWGVIVMSHVPLNTGTDGAALSGLLDAYNNRRTYTKTVDVSGQYWGANVSDDTYKKTVVNADFTGAKGEVIASFHGHIHGDRIYPSYYTFPMITITTAGADVRDQNPVERVVGTATETAMDIVSIDMETRNIYCTRIGAGADRSITY